MKAEWIDSMGSDLTVVNAARVSFDKESQWVPAEGDDFMIAGADLAEKDEKLIHYLAKHNHFTPFTHCMVTVRETVPIFVARQRLKHFIGFSYNEVSRRYVDAPPEFYDPVAWRLRPDSSIKQGSGATLGEQDELNVIVGEQYAEHLKNSQELYEELIRKGICPEQARMVLPQSMYTSYYVTGSLAAWARAYKLRIDSHAQKEIQDLAKQWDEIIKPLFPVSWDALKEN